MLKLLVAPALIILPALALADEMPYWYGRITIEQVFHKETTETYDKPGDAYYPGSRKIVDDQTWSGTIEYLPGKRETMSGTYTSNYHDDRKTQSTRKCLNGTEAESHDFESREHESTVGGSQETKNSLSIYIGDDGSYRLGGGWGLPAKPGAQHMATLRELYDGCRKNPLDRHTDSANTFGLVPPVPFMLTANAGTLPPQTLEGSLDLPTQNEFTKLHVEWNLTRAEPKLMARIAAPASFKRGDVVTLDASGSIGDITEYRWHFALGENCSPGVPTSPDLELKGAKLTFHALCDFRAFLTIKSAMGEGAATKTPWLHVEPRRGAAWKTKFATKKGPELTERLMAEHIRLGVNQCAKHPGDFTSGHFLHTAAENNRTWIDDGYEAQQLSDEGPFNGMWWVASQKLEIDRLERVNKNLTNGGEAATVNKKHGTLADFLAIRPQVAAHEAMHSSLLKDALDQLGENGDPAALVEGVLGGSREIVQTFADMKIRDVEQLLRDATTDTNVANRLRAGGALNRAVTIWLPDTNGDERSKALGPLWSLGE